MFCMGATHTLEYSNWLQNKLYVAHALIHIHINHTNKENVELIVCLNKEEWNVINNENENGKEEWKVLFNNALRHFIYGPSAS